MSTWLYLKCTAHTPPLYSEDVGQHLYDLPRIREELVNRDTLVGSDAHVNYFTGHARRFLRQHPNCPIGIEDEYGRDHPIIEQEDKA